MQTVENEVTVRELGGEIWTEVSGLCREGLNLEVSDLNEFIDTAVGVLARHTGKTLVNDPDLPVVPLAVTFVDSE